MSFVIVLGVLVALIVAFGIFPGPVISFAQNAVPALVGPLATKSPASPKSR